MELIDFDGLFDEKLAIYMEEKKDKYTERQWEDVIPRLYKKFGDTYVAKIGCTPKEYYARMTNGELVETLSAHLSADVPVPEFLCNEIEARGHDEGVRVGADNADAVCARVLQAYRDGIAREYMLEILSRVKARNEEIFDILMQEFRVAEELTPIRASYLAAYGDARALPELLNRIEDRSIGFVEFQELKYAIEALGGEYTEPRDFSADKDYLAIEDASARVLASAEEKS